MKGAVEFTTRDGEIKFGYIVRIYHAFEGDCERRYVFKCEENGREYRCVLTIEGYKECVI